MNAPIGKARGEGNCAGATQGRKEACEEVRKRRVCTNSPPGPLLTSAARLRTETSYEAGSVRRVSPTSRSRSQLTGQVKGELAQRQITFLSGETCTGGMRAAAASASKACLKTWNALAQAGTGGAGVSRGRSTEGRTPPATGRTKR